MVIVMVTANSRNTRPTMPPIRSTGMNTAINAKVMEMMVKPISREPFSAASNGAMPPSIWRMMFSSITMASSTTNPTDSVSASSVMLLIEYPNPYIAAQVAISEIGTASAGMSGGRRRPQEKENHQHDQHDGDCERHLHVFDGVADRHRTVGEQFHLDRRRDLGAVGRQPFIDGIDDLRPCCRTVA